MMQVNSQKYAVVDLEANGCLQWQKIIQVGIVIIENLSDCEDSIKRMLIRTRP